MLLDLINIHNIGSDQFQIFWHSVQIKVPRKQANTLYNKYKLAENTPQDLSTC